MSEETIFMFNANSADKPPGSGVMEIISPCDKKNNVFSMLRKIANWRKMLSNEFIMVNTKLGINGLLIDDKKWASVEHFLLGSAVHHKMPDEYENLMFDGIYGHNDISKIKSLLNIKRYDVKESDLQKALNVKFDSEINPYMCKVLKATKFAKLTSWKRGMQCNQEKIGFKIAKDSLLTDELMRIRSSLCENNEEDECKKDVSLAQKQNETETKTKTEIEQGSRFTKNNNKDTNTKNREQFYETKHVTTDSIQSAIKILSKKDIDNYEDFISKYNPNNNTTSNILTIYEKTNLIGIRMEQLALGAKSYLDHDLAIRIGDVKNIATKEFEERKIPFLICRSLPDNTKEYWKLDDMRFSHTSYI